MKKLSVSTLLFLTLAFVEAAAIASSAQTLTTLHNFAGTDGQGPAASMILARDGNFYGTTFLGGAQQGGTIFKITPSGSFSVFYNFCSKPQCDDGSSPMAGLVQGSDGKLGQGCALQRVQPYSL